MPETLTAPARRFARTPLRAAAAVSVSAHLPEAVRSTAEVAARLGVEEDWIVSRTGIRERRVAAPGETVADLATAAGAAALERAGVAPADVDLLLVATMSPDEACPNAAPRVAAALGAHRAGAIDVGAACTGFLSGLALAAAHIESGRADCVLLIGAEILTRLTNPDDRRTAAIFGDGAGAVVLRPAQGGGGFGPVLLGADGSQAETIIVPRETGFIEMDGQETFRNAVARLTAVTRDAADAAGVALDDIDLFVYHQANARITRAVGARLDLPAERVVDSIALTGNTSAATLPLALAAAEADGRLRPGARVLLAAFGAGFTWGGTVCTWGGA